MDRIRREIQFDKILDKFIQFLINKNIIYYDSIDSYFSRKEPTLCRKIKFYLRFLILVIFSIKFSLLLFYPETLQSILLKDATIIFGKQAYLLHAFAFSIGMVTLVGKLIIAYYESRQNLYFCNLAIDWKARKPLYQISQRHLKKLTLRSFIMYYGFIRYCGSIGMLIVTLLLICATIVTYLYLDYGNVIVLCFWTICFVIVGNEIIFTLVVTTYSLTIPIALLNYLFDELIDKLRVSIRWNNEQRLHQVLQSL